jgi:protein-disulfide isomerase
MNLSFGRYSVLQKWIFKAAVLILLCMGLISSPIPALAASPQLTDAQLEAKVLQILRKNPEVILESVQAYQQKIQQQQQQAQKAFLQQIQTNPRLVMGSSPTTGATEAKIVLIEFSDFQCPYCARANQTLKQFMANHQEQVTLVYKNLPLTSIHPQAMPAAKAAWAASQQGKFWQFHDALFENQDKLSEPFYVATAQSLNLDLKRFEEDRNSNAASVAIQQDVQIAQEIGVDGTPWFAMNGQSFSGAVELAELEAILSQASNS